MVEHPKMNPLVTRLDGSMDSIMGLSKQVVGRLLLEAIADGGRGIHSHHHKLSRLHSSVFYRSPPMNSRVFPSVKP